MKLIIIFSLLLSQILLALDYEKEIDSNASYEITVLATNISNYGGFGEWSFSALYENDKESILFDTGFHEDTVLHNAKILNKDLGTAREVSEILHNRQPLNPFFLCVPVRVCVGLGGGKTCVSRVQLIIC